MKCAFCECNDKNERIIYSNKLVEAFLSNQPIVIGHTLIIPKRCVATFEELTDEEKDAIFGLMKKIKIALKETFNCEGFNFAWNEGENLLDNQCHIFICIFYPEKQEIKESTNIVPENFYTDRELGRFLSKKN